MSEPVDRLALTQRVWGDSRSGRYYTLPEGEPIGAARLLCSAPRLTPNPEPSPGTSDTADRYFKEDPLPLEVKDTHLQLYYVHMQWALRTCHPMLLGDEVSNLMDTLEVEGDHAESSIPRLAKILAQAGYQKIEYSRSCALVAYEIHRRVRSISPAASELFVRSLVCAVTEVFRGYYFERNLWHLSGHDGMIGLDELEMVNVAGFAGDLFALGLLPSLEVHETIIKNLVYKNVVSPVHCRALYLFLLHAKAHIGPSIGLPVLVDVRRELIERMKWCPMSHLRMARLWAIECCEVIEQTVEQDYIAVWGGKPQVVDYEWDPLISKVGWFSSLTSQISPQGPVV